MNSGLTALELAEDQPPGMSLDRRLRPAGDLRRLHDDGVADLVRQVPQAGAEDQAHLGLQIGV